MDDHSLSYSREPEGAGGTGVRLPLLCEEGDPPHWMLLNPKLHESAREITEDISGYEFILLSGLRPPTSSASEIWDEVVPLHKLIPLLWYSEGLRTSWLRHAFGPSMSKVQKVTASSPLNKVYRCLDCDIPLQTEGRELFLRRRNSLKVILDADAGGIVPTKSLCDLLCLSCAEIYLVARQIRIEDLRAMSYQEYLCSLEWQKIREAKLKEVGRHCQACRQIGLLDVHHARYTDLGDEALPDLYIFCRTCHRKHHGIRREVA